VFGLRKIGKTSLLGRVQDLLDSDTSSGVNVTAFLRCNAARLRGGRWFAVVSDLIAQWTKRINDIAVNQGSKTQVRELRLPAVLATGRPAPTDSAVGEAFEKDVAKLMKAGRSLADARSIRFIAIFDEADRLYPSAPDAGWWKGDYFSLWDTLQSLRAGLDDPAELVYFLGGVNPSGVEAGSLVQRPNPLFELSKIFLSPLPRDESDSLLTGLGARVGLTFDDSALALAHDITGGHPWLLRKLGACSTKLIPTGLQGSRSAREQYGEYSSVLSQPSITT